ncbi:MAG TPA: MATE family efflux transporter [Thermoanaerobaculaceae bacterium]|nr:MATE family efflux transporter [Thermoanaerobaculaceae bacterium]HRS14842.1 MATE family efflux transporter [Thermoanaerobaculaceae bacterium]
MLVGIMTLLREALAGAERDYTTVPVGRAVIFLAVPMVLEMTMEATFAITDVFWVSRLGVDAVATVGLTEAVLTLLYALAGGLGIATTAVVSRRIGEGQPARAVTAAVQAIILGLAISAVIGVPGALLGGDILRLMGGSESVAATGAGYASVVFGSSVTVVLIFLVNAAFRGAGDAALAMRVLWLANGINLVLDPCLIFGWGPFPEMGVTGAAVATALGRGIGVAYQFRVLARGAGRIRVRRADIAVRLREIGLILRLAVGGTLQNLIATASWIALVRIVGAFGSAAVAGYTIAIRIIVFALLPSWGLSGSAATMMGQNLGAGRPDRAERAVWIAGSYNVVFLLAVAVVFVAGARPLVGFFSHDPEVLAYGIESLRWVAYGYGFYGLGMVLVQAFNGAGDTTTPTVMNFGCYWLFQIPLAYVLAFTLEWGARGVFVAVPVAESLLTVVAVLTFRQGRWKTRQV